MIAWGPDFRRGVVDSLPVGIVDVAPTVLDVLGVSCDSTEMDGRVLREALVADERGVPHVVRDTVTVSDGAGYRARVARAWVGGHAYIDGGWRVP
jgi:arylsulfatase A-like enzyme